MARNTVRKYVRQPPEPPLPTPRPLRASQLDPYEDYLLERNAAQLYREIKEQGYRGAATIVRASIGHLRRTTADGSPARSRKQRAKALSPHSLRWLLTRKRTTLNPEETTRLDQLLSLSAEVETVYGLLQAFLKMVRERQHQNLRPWMVQAVSSGIPELASFVTGVERDYDAVNAALRLPWRKAHYRGKGEQIEDAQKSYVWSCWYSSLAATALTRRLLSKEELFPALHQKVGRPKSPLALTKERFACFT